MKAAPRKIVPRAGRDERREAILDVARQVFYEEGYSAASMSTIAARVGGSKGTLYNYFKSKEELFEAHVRERCARNAKDTFALPTEGADLRKVLTGLGERFLHLILSDESTRLYRVVVAEAQRHPEVGRIFYESGPKIGIGKLAALLEDARKAGQIEAKDCMKAAQDLLSLCHGSVHLSRVLNIIPPLTEKEIRAEAARIAATFMRAYAPGNGEGASAANGKPAGRAKPKV